MPNMRDVIPADTLEAALKAAGRRPGAEPRSGTAISALCLSAEHVGAWAKSYTYTIPDAAPGAPRQVQSDKWARRPCVLAYRAWCDAVRRACPVVPPAALVGMVSIAATYTPPTSWKPAARQMAMSNYRAKRSKPDCDNIAKAILDALWEQDAAIPALTVSKRWGPVDEVNVLIVLDTIKEVL